MFRHRATTKVSQIYVSADVSLALLFSTTARRTIVRKMWKLMRRRRTCSLPGNYRSMTQANLEWHADHPARKVDHWNGDSDGSPVNRSDLQLDLLQPIPIPPSTRSVDYFRCGKVYMDTYIYTASLLSFFS